MKEGYWLDRRVSRCAPRGELLSCLLHPRTPRVYTLNLLIWSYDEPKLSSCSLQGFQEQSNLQQLSMIITIQIITTDLGRLEAVASTPQGKPHSVAKRYFVPPPADCNLPPPSGAGSLRSPKFVRRDTILFSSNLS